MPYTERKEKEASFGEQLIQYEKDKEEFQLALGRWEEARDDYKVIN